MSKLFYSKRGDEKTFPMMLVLKLIFAIALILLVLWFGSKIWAALFPSSDAATEKSFDNLASTLQLKIANTQYYDSSYMSLYLLKDYHVLFFGPGDRVKCGNYFQSPTYVLKPDVCTNAQYCLCLYKDQPESGTSPDPKNKNNNVVKCTELKPRTNTQLAMKQFDLVNDNCYRVNTDQFQPIIVAENSLTSNTQQLYVWSDSDANKLKDSNFKKVVCQAGDPLCAGHTEGLLTGDMSLYPKILNACTANKIATLSASCKLDTSLNRCNLICSTDEIKCTAITKCSDYAKYADDGTMTGIYILKNSAAQWACANDAQVCKAGKTQGCNTYPKMYFFCDKTKIDCVQEFSKIDANDKTTCSIVQVFQDNKWLAVGYDESIVGCDNMFKKYTAFSTSSQVYQLNWDNGDELIQNSVLMTGCGFVQLGSGLLANMVAGTQECNDAIVKYMTDVYDCRARS